MAFLKGRKSYFNHKNKKLKSILHNRESTFLLPLLKTIHYNV